MFYRKPIASYGGQKNVARSCSQQSDRQQYVRQRKGAFCIYSGEFALQDASVDFNRKGHVRLLVAGNVRTTFPTPQQQSYDWEHMMEQPHWPGEPPALQFPV